MVRLGEIDLIWGGYLSDDDINPNAAAQRITAAYAIYGQPKWVIVSNLANSSGGVATYGLTTAIINYFHGFGIKCMMWAHSMGTTYTLAQLKAQIDYQMTLGPEIDGFNIDETDMADLAYYTDIYNYIKTLDPTLTVSFNTGQRDASDAFAALGDWICTESNYYYFATHGGTYGPGDTDLYPHTTPLIAAYPTKFWGMISDWYIWARCYPAGPEYNSAYIFSSNGQTYPLTLSQAVTLTKEAWNAGIYHFQILFDSITTDPPVGDNAGLPVWWESYLLAITRYSYPTYTVTVASSSGGSTSPSGTITLPPETSLSVAATANPNYVFTKWVLDGVDVGSANPYTLIGVVDGVYTLTAVFTSTVATIDLTVVAGADGSVLPVGVQTLTVGSTYTYTATADPTFAFNYWTLDTGSTLWLYTSGQNIYDSNGNQVKLNACVIQNGCGNPISQTDIQNIKAMGFNAIRWWLYWGGSVGSNLYQPTPASMNVNYFTTGQGEPSSNSVDDIVNWCQQAGLYIILCPCWTATHPPPAWTTLSGVSSDGTALWTDATTRDGFYFMMNWVAQRYATRSNVVFEGVNEISGNSETDADQPAFAAFNDGWVSAVEQGEGANRHLKIIQMLLRPSWYYMMTNLPFITGSHVNVCMATHSYPLVNTLNTPWIEANYPAKWAAAIHSQNMPWVDTEFSTATNTGLSPSRDIGLQNAMDMFAKYNCAGFGYFCYDSNVAHEGDWNIYNVANSAGILPILQPSMIQPTGEGTVNLGSTNPLPLVTLLSMDGQTLTAVFTAVPPTQMPLTIVTSGSGSVELGDGVHTFNVGDTVTFIATPASQNVFSQWTLGAANYSDNPLTITITAGMVGKTLTALFMPSVQLQDAPLTGGKLYIAAVQTISKVSPEQLGLFDKIHVKVES